MPFMLMSALLQEDISYSLQRPLAKCLKFKAMRWNLQVVKRCIKKTLKINQLLPTSQYFKGLCEKMTQMCMYFKTKTDVAQNLINKFFLILTVRRPFHRKDFKWKKIWGYGVNFWENWNLLCRTRAASNFSKPVGHDVRKK